MLDLAREVTLTAASFQFYVETHTRAQFDSMLTVKCSRYNPFLFQVYRGQQIDSSQVTNYVIKGVQTADLIINSQFISSVVTGNYD